MEGFAVVSGGVSRVYAANPSKFRGFVRGDDATGAHRILLIEK
jgi:hypothetical protein